MSTSWEEKKLKSILKLEYGKPLDVSHRSPNGLYPAYGANGEKTRTNKFYFDKPSIIVGRKGSAGEIKLTEEKFWPLDVTYFVTFNEKEHDLRFLYYLLSKLELPKLAKGVKPGINRNDVYAKKVNVPNVREQKRIVALLDDAFEAIDISIENAKKNLQNARELFQNYLNEVFLKGGNGWVERKLGEIASTQYGLSKSMNDVGKGFKIFRMGELQDGKLLDTGKMKYADIDIHEFKKYQLFPEDILFNRTNSFELVGKTGIFELSGDYCFASYLIRILPKKGIILPQLLNYLMNSSGFQESIKQKASKSINQANINATILSNEKICFPSLIADQRTIIECLHSLKKATRHLESVYQKKLTALEELKKSLLHQAFSGEL